MRRLFAAVAACVTLICLAQARPGPDSNYNISVSAGGGGGGAVTAQDLGTALNCASGTSCNYTNLTIAGGLTNSALAVFAINDNNGAAISGLSATWDSGGSNQAMTNVVSQSSGNSQTWIFGLLSPTAGNKTLALSWTGTARLFVCAMSLSHVSQSAVATSFLHGVSAPLGAGANPPSNTVTSQVSDLVLDVWGSGGSWNGTFSGTQVCLSNGGTVYDLAASYDPGGASVTATASAGGSVSFMVSGIDVVHD